MRTLLNILAGRTFYNVSDLNEAAISWCDNRNRSYHKEVDGIPSTLHEKLCMKTAHLLAESNELLKYLCPERKLSFDGFVNYEGRRFGVPFRYRGKTVRISRNGYTIKIYSPDLKDLLVTHDVTWSKKDRFCIDQFPFLQPEEFLTAPVKTEIDMLPPQHIGVGFDKFDFDREDSND